MGNTISSLSNIPSLLYLNGNQVEFKIIITDNYLLKCEIKNRSQTTYIQVNDSQDTHPEPDILECEVRWAL